MASLSGYTYPRSLRPEDREYVAKAFALALNEMSDCGNVTEMFPPLATLVNFVLANRRIRTELSELSR